MKTKNCKKNPFNLCFMYLSYYMLREEVGISCGWLKINKLLYVWKMKNINLLVRDRHFTCKNKESFDN